MTPQALILLAAILGAIAGAALMFCALRRRPTDYLPLDVPEFVKADMLARHTATGMARIVQFPGGER